MLLIVSFLLMTVLNETMGVSFIIPAAQCDLHMSTSDKGLLSSMTFFGKLINNMYNLVINQTVLLLEIVFHMHKINSESS